MGTFWDLLSGFVMDGGESRQYSQRDAACSVEEEGRCGEIGS